MKAQQLWPQSGWKRSPQFTLTAVSGVQLPDTRLFYSSRVLRQYLCCVVGGGGETTHHLNNVLMRWRDAGSLSEGCYSDGVVQSCPHNPESKPHTSTEMWWVTTGQRSGVYVTSRAKATTSPQSWAGSQHRQQRRNNERDEGLTTVKNAESSLQLLCEMMLVLWTHQWRQVEASGGLLIHILKC